MCVYGQRIISNSVWNAIAPNSIYLINTPVVSNTSTGIKHLTLLLRKDLNVDENVIIFKSINLYILETDFRF